MKGITEQQVNATHNLFKLMRKLRVIGLVDTKITSYSMSEDGGSHRLYDLEIRQYFPGIFRSHEDYLDELADYAVSLSMYDDDY